MCAYVSLKTAKETMRFRCAPPLLKLIQEAKVKVGDVIYFGADGTVKHQGRSDAYASESDMEVIKCCGFFC